MRLSHFHLHSRAVYRSSGHSAVAAAAYQANEKLTGEKKNRGSVSLDFRKELNKGHISEGLRTELGAMGITLSDAAQASKDGRREWTITDGDAVYSIREYRQTSVNKETGKQETVRQSLDVYGASIYDFSRKGDMIDKWMQAPQNAPSWVAEAVGKQDRQGFWNAAEAAEHNRNGRPARTIEMALSRDLSMAENKALVQAFIKQQLTDKGMVADVAIHSKTASDGRKNIHAHILFTARTIDSKGEFAEEKNGYWNSKERIKEFRQAWASMLNRTFEEKGLDVRVDHRSFQGQGIDREPGEHLGPAAAHMEQRGKETDKGNANRRKDLANAVQEALNPPKAASPPTAPTALPAEAEPLHEAVLEYYQHDSGGSAPRAQGAALPPAAQSLHREVRDYYQRSDGLAATAAQMASRLAAFGRAFLRRAVAFARDESSGGESSLLDRYASAGTSWRERIERERKRERHHER